MTHVPLSYAALRAGNFDIAHAFYPNDALAAVRWRRRTGLPAVLSYLGIPSREWLNGLRRRRVLEVSLRGCDTVVALSRHAAEEFERVLGYQAPVTLDTLVAMLRGRPSWLSAAASRLRHNGVYMVGVGYETPLSADESWMYFPQPDVPFYRATNFAKYAATNVPGADTARYCSFMTETAHSEDRPVVRAGLEDRVESGLRTSGVVTGRPAVASIHVEQIEYAYPIPTLDRDRALATIEPWLMRRGIFSPEAGSGPGGTRSETWTTR